MSRRPVFLAAVLALLALALAGCATTRPEASESASSTANLPAPGVNGDTVKVGFQITDIAGLRKRIGFKGVATGTPEQHTKAINAFIAYANSQPGTRKIEAFIRQPVFSSGDSSCRAFTQDNSVFAVVIGGAFDNATRPCYKAARTVMLDLTAISHDQTEFEEYTPYLWAPDQPELGAFTRAQIKSLVDRGWFTGSKGVSVVVPDGEVTRRVGKTVVVPALNQLGITNTPLYTIDASNVGTLGKTISDALSGSKSSGVDRVFVVGGARIMGIMVSDNAASKLDVKYALSTVDLPSFLVDNAGFIVDGVREGMAGLGYARSTDLRLSSDPFPDPAKPSEVLCKQLIDDAGAAPPENNRENYEAMFAYCDVVLMVKAGIDNAAPGPLTPNSFREGVWKAGSSLQFAVPNTTSLTTGHYAGASTATPLSWDSTCQLPDRTDVGCFKYDGPPVNLDGSSAPASVAASP